MVNLPRLVPSACRTAGPYDPLWFRNQHRPTEEMAKVAARSPVPIATGERLCTKYEFARVLRCGAAAILQPNLGRAGGILEGKKIAAIAETYYAQIAPHLYCGPVVAAANIQLATATPNFLILESIQKMDGFHASLLHTPLSWKMAISYRQKPGAGRDTEYGCCCQTSVGWR